MEAPHSLPLPVPYRGRPVHAFANRHKGDGGSKKKWQKRLKFFFASFAYIGSFAFIGSIASPCSCMSGRAVQPRGGLD